MKKLLNETPWSKTYVNPDGMRIYESKLKIEGTSVDPALIQEKWSEWTQSERFDLSKALAAKTVLSAEDERVLQFLIQTDEDVIASTVANAVGRLRDRGVAITLLLTRMSSCKEPRANFYQVLSKFQDARVRAALSAEYTRIKKQIDLGKKDQYMILDYLACCAALAQLESDRRYMDEIKAYAESPNEIIRNFTQSLRNHGL